LPEPITDIADLVAQVEQSAAALMAGDIDRYLPFIHHAEDYTRLNPAGGPARHGFDDSPESRRTVTPIHSSIGSVRSSWPRSRAAEA
jgi:hypothetical protein